VPSIGPAVAYALGEDLVPVSDILEDLQVLFPGVPVTSFNLYPDVLPPGAVVVMTRLCSASGNSELGLPEGTLRDARQRVDNHAVGWIKAGARAVIADAFTSPAYYARALLGGPRQDAASIWRRSPNHHGHVHRGRQPPLRRGRPAAGP
jgi:hypothetical protein